jgi:hypothetical protein
MKKILLLIPIFFVGHAIWDIVQTLRYYNDTPIPAYGTHVPWSMQSSYRYHYHGREQEFIYPAESIGTRLSVDPNSATGMPDLALPEDAKRGRVMVIVASDN